MRKNSIFTDCTPGSTLCLYLFLLCLCFVCLVFLIHMAPTLECANPVKVGPQQMSLQCGTLTGQTSWITNPFSRTSPLSSNSSPQDRLLCPLQHNNPSSLRMAPLLKSCHDQGSPHSKLCLAPSYCCFFPLRSLSRRKAFSTKSTPFIINPCSTMTSAFVICVTIMCANLYLD